MYYHDPFVQHVLNKLSAVRYRTVPEIRPDLPDLPWRDLSREHVEEFWRTYRALRLLIARGDVVVRLREVNVPCVATDLSVRTTRRRQEFKIAGPSGGKRSGRWLSLGLTMLPKGSNA